MRVRSFFLSTVEPMILYVYEKWVSKLKIVNSNKKEKKNTCGVNTITSRTPSSSLTYTPTQLGQLDEFFRAGFLGRIHPGAQYSTRQRFPPSYSCITLVDNTCAFFKPASPEGRHHFPPVLTSVIHRKTSFIDTKLSLGLEGIYLKFGEWANLL